MSDAAPETIPAAETPEPKRRERPPAEKRGLLVFLTLGMLAGVGGCVFVSMSVGQGVELARDFGRELSGLAQFYVSTATGAYVIPVFTWIVALAVTKGGRTQHNIGSMLAILMFAFAVLWAAGSVMAFMDSYNPGLSAPPSTMP
ncbi:MAG: hypothetical protein H6839_02175 [Planctomycetes bacterium]|nr:hypothetical protein [Planctomycetota bacterium]